MTELSSRWVLRYDVSPEWLFFRLDPDPAADPLAPLAERIWETAATHKIYRIVMELDSGVMLTSHLAGQLVLLHKRCHEAKGVARICGLNAASYEVLKIMRLHDRFPNYPTRHDAINGRRPEAN
jgi:hypothetical protein